ncbi:P1 family peptidase [Psychromicrobium lacuslunae]|uniref:Peptidase S58 n=1 Tax=Psychromicrobium lacuslunae TaxID=1618207 RepID=A0A0D4BZD8_9MICC|nr:P1 family peptidase [Psychromicrobium lacuslunae]AJT41688.1 peptidase S58 [Psychromicrobium lacuslunae]
MTENVGVSGGQLTDVPGVLVGQAERIGEGWLTGVSVVIPPAGSIGAVDVRGGGPGTHETDALDPTTLVPTVDAVALTGGSAYGLAAAHGVMRWCEEQGRGFEVLGGRVPIVPAAAIFDLGRGGDFSLRPDSELGYQAAQDANTGQVRRGNVGAGTGATLGRGIFKGGVGTASVRMRGLNSEVVIGALVVVNALGHPLGADETLRNLDSVPGLNTTLAVVASNARLSPAQAKRTSVAAHAGMARALAPIHTLLDGDTIFTLATGELELKGQGPADVIPLVELQSLAAVAVQAAIEDAIAAAETITTPVATFSRWPV